MRETHGRHRDVLFANVGVPWGGEVNSRKYVECVLEDMHELNNRLKNRDRMISQIGPVDISCERSGGRSAVGFSYVVVPYSAG